MNKPVSSIMTILLIVSSGTVMAQTAAVDTSDSGNKPAAVSEAAPSPAPAGTEADTQPAAEKTQQEKAVTPAKPPEPISDAFGIPLGKPFQPSMVDKVLSEKEFIYTGKDGKKIKGSLYQVQPSQPDKRFQHYSVKTTPEGLVYAIQGDYQVKPEPDNIKQHETKPERDAAKQEKAQQKKGKHSNYLQKTCKAEVKALAKELESKYGKPRGQGYDGLWFAFRQYSDSSNLSLRLFGHRCRSGMYSIAYTDEKLQKGVVPAKPTSAPRKKEVETAPANPAVAAPVTAAPVEADKAPADPLVADPVDAEKAPVKPAADSDTEAKASP